MPHSYYRWGKHVVCIVDDEDSPIGQRLMVPKFGKDVPKAIRKQFPKLPGKWRRLIEEAIQEREEATN